MKNTKIEILKNKAKQELEEDEKYNNEISENIIEKVINKISKEYVVKRSFFNGYQVAILINSSIFTNIKARISLLHLICSQKMYNLINNNIIK